MQFIMPCEETASGQGILPIIIFVIFLATLIDIVVSLDRHLLLLPL